MRHLPPLIFIGGIPTAGKTTVAKKLAHELGMDFLSTDIVCKLVFAVTTKKQFPNIHYFRTQNADRYYTRHTPQEFVDHFVAESKEIVSALMTILPNNKAITTQGLIVEGSALLPELVAPLTKTTAAQSIFLQVPTPATIEHALTERGLWATEATAKQKEAECLFALNTYIVKKAQKLHLPCVDVEPRTTLERRIKKILAL